MIILSSDGLSSETVLAQFKAHLPDSAQKAALITTASNPFAETDPNIERHVRWMEACGLGAARIDIETQNPALLKGYDVVILMGGNPYYLLKIIQQKECGPLFGELKGAGKVIAGVSAGTMVMGPTIDFVNALTPEMNVGLTDFAGLGLTGKIVCPHASTFVAGIEGGEAKLAAYQKEHQVEILRINDGQALFMGEGGPMELV